MMNQVLLLRSTENVHIFEDLAHAYPTVKWIDIPMPFLPGHGESDSERQALLDSVRNLVAPYAAEDAPIFYARAYGAFSQTGRQALADAFNAPLITAPGAVLAYADAHKWRDIFVLTPYGQERHALEVQWAQAQGLNVVASACLGYDSGIDIGNLTPDALIPAIATGNQSPAQAIYLACTITRTVAFHSELHAKTGLPVISATEAMLWSLRNLGFLS